MNWFSFIQKYFGLFFAAGMGLGLFYPDYFIFISDYALLVLGCVMGLTFLSIDFDAALQNLKQIKNIGLVFIITKIVLPFILFHAAGLFAPEIRIAVLLLALTPFAAIAPTLTRLIGGDAEFILVEQVLQTLAAPLYMPLMFELIAGSSIEIEIAQMVKVLVFLIIIPFIFSAVLRLTIKPVIIKTRKYYGALSILLITLLLCGLLASASGPISADPMRSLPLLLLSLLFAVILLFSGWFSFLFLDKRKRIGTSLGNTYMNIGLSAVLAAKFFGPDVLLFVLLYEFPANLLPPLLRKLK